MFGADQNERDHEVLSRFDRIGTDRGRVGTGLTLVLRCPRRPRVAQLATDNQVSAPTAYLQLHEGIDVLAAMARPCTAPGGPPMRAGHIHVQLDGD